MKKTFKRKPKKRRNLFGGKVIGSGGYGCIFNPSLKCKNNKTNENDVSKLMSIKHANDEYNEIKNFNDILSVIPNYKDYFLLDGFYLCNVDQLTNEDLSNFNQKCSALKKQKITESNINDKLDKLLALNMPYGGIDVETYLEKESDENMLVELNNKLIELLEKGIIKMNDLNVYHCDIKDSNVLVLNEDNKKISTRLIDWGLSVHHKNKDSVPKKLYRRPFQYNVPFSAILFNKDFVNRYNIFLQINKSPDYFMVREFIVKYIFIWIDIRGAGHLRVINNFMKKFFYKNLPNLKEQVKKHLIEYDFTYYYIIEYLTKIVYSYTKNGKLFLLDYFNNIFLKNIDIWGFTMIYSSLFEILHEKYNNLNYSQMIIYEKIKYIIIHYLFENPLEIIDINNLTNELKTMNSNLKTFYTSKRSNENIIYTDNYNVKYESLNLTSSKPFGGKKSSKTKKTINKKSRKTKKK